MCITAFALWYAAHTSPLRDTEIIAKVLTFAVLGVLVAAGITWASEKLLGPDLELGKAPTAAKDALSRSARRIQHSTKYVWSILLGPRNHKTPWHISIVSTVERISSLRVFLSLYLLLVAAAFAFVLLALPSLMRQNDQQLWEISSAIVGVNALLISTLTTLAALTTCALMFLLTRAIGPTPPALDLRAAAQTVVTWVGGGTAVGLVCATLSPVMAFMPGNGSQISRALNPSVLVDFPAAGAAAGYILGISAATVVILNNITGVLFRRWIAPATYVGCVALLATQIFSPREILVQLSQSVENTAIGTCTDLVSRTHALVAPDILVAFNKCDGSWPALDGSATAWLIAGTTFMPTLFFTVRDVTQASKKHLLTETP